MAIAATILIIDGASANEFEGPLKDVTMETIKVWLRDPAVVAAMGPDVSEFITQICA